MRNKKYIFGLVSLVYALFGWSQDVVLCSLQSDYFKIENSVNIPNVTSNANNTITLTFLDDDVTEVFNNYTIYDFFQTFPNSSETLQQYYTITFDTKNLIEDLSTNVPADIIVYGGTGTDTTSFPIKTDISQNIIDHLDGNTYELTKFISTSDTDPCSHPCTLVDVPENLNFTVSFNYDVTQEILYMASYEPTTCGNSFSIGLAGGNPNYLGNIDNTLQLWNSTPGVSAIIDSPQPCNGFESEVFSVLDIACNGYNIGNIEVLFNSETSTFQFYRENLIFGYHILEFSTANLSIEEEVFEKIKPYQTADSPYLQLSNLNNQIITIDIFNTSGQEVMRSKTFEENSLNISNLPNGLYFIKLSNLKNQQKIFKFLKN